MSFSIGKAVAQKCVEWHLTAMAEGTSNLSAERLQFQDWSNVIGRMVYFVDLLREQVGWERCMEWDHFIFAAEKRRKNCK